MSSHEQQALNPMTRPRLDKVTVNVCVGKPGEPLEKASKVVQELTGQKPILRNAKKTIKDFGIRKGEPISCVVTLRRKKAEEFLSKTLKAVGNKLSERSFDERGNFSFGLKEHIEIHGAQYRPELGIIGMDISATLRRAGYRVRERKRAKCNVGKRHLLTRGEAMKFATETFGVEIVGLKEETE